MAIITLITDFGLQDEYVGVLKGVILDTDRRAAIVDITHGIAPQDVVGAGHTLKAAHFHFPKGTIHAAIIDPGVGTRRKIIAAYGDGYLFIAPDNGLLWPTLSQCNSVSVYRVDNPKLYRHPVSRTFHGRDIIAPVAAHLSIGIDLEAVGSPMPLKDIHPLEEMGPKRVGNRKLEGRIISVDRYGNLITDINSDDLAIMGTERLLIILDHVRIRALSEAYAKGHPDKCIAIIGSRNTLEIAVNGGSAAQLLGKGRGDIVRVEVDC